MNLTIFATIGTLIAREAASKLKTLSSAELLSLIRSLPTLFATLMLAMAFVGIGRLTERICKLHGRGLDAAVAWLTMGWAVASLTAAFCAIADVGLYWPALALLVLAVAGFGLTPQFRPIGWLGLSWLLVAPLIFVASRIPPTIFDEFAHWLPNIRYTIEHGRFPNKLLPNIWSNEAAYPPAIPVIGYGAQQFFHGVWDLAPKIFTVVLGAGFGLALAERIRRMVGPGLSVALGVSFATVLDPFFDPRYALTAYADVPTGFILAYLILVCWRQLQEPDRNMVCRVAGLSILLVLLRETNIFLIVGITAGLVLTSRQGRKTAAASFVPAAGAFLLWRGYIILAALPPTQPVRALADWRWGAPWAVLKSLLVDRLANNPALGGLAIALLVSLAVILIARRRLIGSLRPLFVIVGTTAAIWIGVVTWAYIAVFPDNEIPRAGSAWRFFSQLGPTLILVCFAIVEAIGEKSNIGSRLNTAAFTSKGLLGLAFAVPALLVLVDLRHWRIDWQYATTEDVRAISGPLKSVVGDAPLTLIFINDSPNGYANQIGYYLHRPVGSIATGRTINDAPTSSYVLDLSDLDFGGCPRLLRWTGAGWTENKALSLPQGCSRTRPAH